MRKATAAIASVLMTAAMLPMPAHAATATPADSLVPLRAVAEAAGARVTWDGATNSVTVIKGDITLVLQIGSTAATVNGRPVVLSQPVRLVADRTLVPATFVTEALGITNPLNLLVHYEGGLEMALFRPAWSADFETYAKQRYPFAATCPGMAYGVAENGRPLLLDSFGARDCEANLSMTTDTVMGLGSSTKSITAVAVMQLVDAGKLSVDDPVTKYLPEYAGANADKATIHHLLTHSTGLPSLPTLFFAMAKSLAADPNAPAPLKAFRPLTTPAEMIAFINAAPMPAVGTPGQVFSYSNDSYALLGEIIHRVSGQTYEEYVTEHILKPAGMTHTAFDDKTMNTFPEVATIYEMKPKQDAPGGVEPMASNVWWDPGVMNAAGGGRSTVQDMLRFTEIFRNKGVVGLTRILSEESVKKMMTPYILADAGISYGYGMFIKQVGGLTVVEHGGSIKGAAAIWSVIPEKGLAGVGLTNIGGVPSETILQGGLNLAAGLAVTAGTEPRPTVTVAPEQLALLAGTYAGGEAAPATITVENDTLVFNQAGVKLPGRMLGEEEFAFPIGGQELTVRFLKNADGKYYALSTGFRVWLKQ